MKLTSAVQQNSFKYITLSTKFHVIILKPSTLYYFLTLRIFPLSDFSCQLTYDYCYFYWDQINETARKVMALPSSFTDVDIKWG